MDQVIVITGASSGIGAEMARQLSSQGAYVVLAARSTDKLKQVGAGLPGKYDIAQLDVSSESSVERTVVKVIRSKKTEVDLPFVAALGTKLYQLFPKLADKISGGLINNK
ncbi:SDR family NAD(P)-dependent oxidoreductase [Paenibacillus caui]|uniref:SDR family NAD(P)-dependent oxidoreductase n=1 Tax=Paenibacillus caui TaxID=2873927 RepID=UPI001CA80205|nr:SDR family NAD(P)-dependent oxidoreductase [Paenibacillus caui]